MLRYVDVDVYTTEIPDRLCAGISFTGCPIHCYECQWRELWDTDIGKRFDYEALASICANAALCDCILFMGGEWDNDLVEYLKWIKTNTNYKTALYSGRTLQYFLKRDINNQIFHYLDYLKVGRYLKRLGGLQSPITNQRLYRLKDGQIVEDITHEIRRTIQ